MAREQKADRMRGLLSAPLLLLVDIIHKKIKKFQKNT